MTHYVVNFGDSWAHAADVECKGYASMIAADLGCKLLDYSKPSTSIANMIVQFRTFLEHGYTSNHKFTALFFVTGMERLMFFDDNGQPRDIWPQSWEDFYAHWYSDAYGEFVANTSVMVLQQMCRSRSIHDIWMLGWQNLTLWPDIDRSRFVLQAEKSLAQMFGGQGPRPLWDLRNRPTEYYLLPDSSHPSVQGHRFIADTVLEHLKGQT